MRKARTDAPAASASTVIVLYVAIIVSNCEWRRGDKRGAFKSSGTLSEPTVQVSQKLALAKFGCLF